MRCFSDRTEEKCKTDGLGDRGVVSQMLCIVIAAVIFFNFAMYDYVAVSHQKIIAKRTNDLACSSIMSSFDGIFQEYFGLYCLDTEKTDTYLMRYYEIMNEERGNLLSSFTRLNDYDKFYVPERNVSDYSIIYTDSLISKPVLKRELYDLMKYKSVGNFAEFILDKIAIMADIKKETAVYEYLEKFDKKLETISNLQKEFEPLLNGTEGLKGSGVNGFFESDVIINLSGKINEVMANCPDGVNVSDTAVLSAVKSSVEFLLIPANTYNVFCVRALDVGRKIEKLCEEAEELLDKAEEAKDSADLSDSLLSETFGSIESRRNKLSACGDFKTINAKIQGNIDALAYSLNKRYALSAYIESNGCINSEILKESIDAIKSSYESYKKIEQGEIHEVNTVSVSIKDLFNKAVDAAGVIFNFVPPQSTEIEKEHYAKIPSQREGILETESFGKKLSFDISGNLISDCLSGFSDLVDKSAGKTSILDWYFIDDYIMTYLNSSLEKKSHAAISYLNGEIEYVIFGSRSDSSNFLSAIVSIALIRLALNITHILRDSEKMEQIQKISDHPAVIAILVFVWSLFETAFDVSNLRNGEGVPFIKGEDDWNCDLNGAKRYVESTLEEKTDGESENITDMTYRDYLRLLLVFVSYDTKISRLQDILELNHYKTEGIYKPLDNFAAAISLESEISIDTILFKNRLGKGKAKWRVVSNGKY